MLLLRFGLNQRMMCFRPKRNYFFVPYAKLFGIAEKIKAQL